MLSREIKPENGVTGSGLCNKIRKLLYAITEKKIYIYISLYSSSVKFPGIVTQVASKTLVYLDLRLPK